MEKRGSVSEHLRMAVAVGNIGLWELDTKTGDAWRNAKHDELFGYAQPLPSWTYDDFLRHVVAEDREEVDEAYGKALKDQREWAFECRIQRTDGMIRWIAAHGRPLPATDGQNERLIGHVIDITETKRGEEHLRLVTAELNHRLMNIISTMHGLIGMAGRGGGDPRDIAEGLQQRLAALGRSHNLTFRDRRAMVPILQALRVERDAMPGVASQVILEIDERMRIAAPLAERLILVIHELGTNALKYGALTIPEGRVCLESRVNEEGDVEIIWREVNGPQAHEPDSEGFGSKLIRTALSADAKVEQTFPETGAVCRITFPAKAVQTTE